MAELFEAVVSWPTLLLVVLVFGLAPGVVLRTIVLCYPKGDPRRTELIADLYVVRYIERPVWVAAQVETAMFEGLAERRRKRAHRRLAQPRHWIPWDSLILTGGALMVNLGGFVALMSSDISPAWAGGITGAIMLVTTVSSQEAVRRLRYRRSIRRWLR